MLNDMQSRTRNCLNGQPPPCAQACPLGLDLRSFMDKAQRGKWNAAHRILRNSMVFPGFICTLCDAPCESACYQDEPLAIRDLVLACNQLATATAPDAFRLPLKDKTVAVIGAGLSGLACALRLATKKYRVSIYERMNGYGGALRNADNINFYMDEIALRFSKENVEFHFNVSVSDLKEIQSDAIYIATGADGLDYGLLHGNSISGALRGDSIPGAMHGDSMPGVLHENPVSDVMHENPMPGVLHENPVSGALHGNPISGALRGDSMPDVLHGKTISDVLHGNPMHGLLYGNSMPGVFAGGGICGMGPVEAVAHGALAATKIEAYFMTGKIETESTKKLWIKELPRPKSSFQTRVKPLGDGYDQAEAKLEASRCMKCDCTLCVDHCEMLGMYGKMPPKITREIKMDHEIIESLSGRTTTRQISSCTGCGQCSKVCPIGIDLGSIHMEARRNRDEEGTYPSAFHDFWMREMDFHLSGEVLRLPEGKSGCKYLFFPGCQLGASNPAYVKEGFAYLQNHLDDENIGLLLSCCGIPARWAGKEKRFSEIMDHRREQWEALGKPVIVTACATCAALLQEKMPEAEQISIYEIIARYGCGGYENENVLSQAAVFDPCSSNVRMAADVRAIAAGLGIQLDELDKRGVSCCGWGGHITPANARLADTIAEHRIGDSELPYITYCANCRDIFSAKGKQSAHILDLVFGLDDGWRSASGINLRRAQSLQLRKLFMDSPAKSSSHGSVPNAPPSPVPNSSNDLVPNPSDPAPDKQSIVISESLQELLDQKMILVEDIQAAVLEAQKNGKVLQNAETGHYLYACETANVTYWVEYSKTADDRILVHNAYCHRMRILHN